MAKKVELHEFFDFLGAAYSAVVYIKIIDSAGNFRVTLIASKSRITPLKQIWIARLELCAVVLLSELIEKTYKIMTRKMTIYIVRLWSFTRK